MKNNINLWVFNHPLQSISDQIFFIKNTFTQNGYSVSVSNQPDIDSLNVVIENFSSSSMEIIRSFCVENKKRVSVVMTEHTDFIGEDIYIHGEKLWSENDYMNPYTQSQRLRWLFLGFPYIRSFFILGDLPELKGISSAFSGIPKIVIPFPKIAYVDPNDKQPNTDMVFTGILTEYRRSIISVIESGDMSLFFPNKFTSVETRDEYNRNSKVILNIPQRKTWQWLSPMRIIAGLSAGRATISLGTNDQSYISECTIQLNIEKEDWIDDLTRYVRDWTISYEQAYANYENMMVEYQKLYPFPHDFLDYWAITETGIEYA